MPSKMIERVLLGEVTMRVITDKLSGKVPMIVPDEESAGIHARAGLYESKRLCKLGILEDALRRLGYRSTSSVIAA